MIELEGEKYTVQWVKNGPLSIEFPWFSGITEFFGDMFQIPFCPSSL